jgi:hypothetical protein
MALISCPDCGSEVSDRAPSCPKCGRPISTATVKVVTDSGPSAEAGGAYGAGFILAWIIFIVRSPDWIDGLIYGFFVAFLSWIYVAYALIVAIFR